VSVEKGSFIMNQTNFNFIESEKAYATRFFRFPQVLIYGSQYKTLSDSAKLGYMILHDRLDYSLKNNWVDEDNRVYFIFTNQELTDLMGWSKKKVIRVKNELENQGLLFQKAMHFNPKTGKNEPNRLYLADLEVTATDIYTKSRQQEPRTLGTRESVKTEPSRKFVKDTPQTLDTRESVKKSHNLDYTNLDTNIDTNIDTAKLDFSSKNFSQSEIKKQNQDLVTNAYKNLTGENVDNSMPFEPETIQLISYWVRTPEQMRSFIGIILNARKDIQADIEKQTGRPVTIIMDTEPELQKGITTTLRRYFNSMRNTDNKNKKINSPENYLYISMKNYFGYWYNSEMAQRNKEASN